MTWEGYMLIGLFAALFVFGCREQASQKTTAQAPKAAVPAPDMSTPGFLID